MDPLPVILDRLRALIGDGSFPRTEVETADIVALIEIAERAQVLLEWSGTIDSHQIQAARDALAEALGETPR